MDYFSSGSSSSSNGKNKKKRGGGNSSGVKLSTDPQSVAARERRHRISDRFKILQSLVPGGSKMDTVSMLEEAINYVKFLKTQIMLHQTIMNIMDDDSFDNFLLPPPHSDSVPPQEQEQQFSYLGSNFVGEMQPSVSLPLFQGQETAVYFDPFDEN